MIAATTGKPRKSASFSLARLADVVRRIVGVPDYDRYVAHLQTCHPGAQPMSRDEFFRQSWDARYSQPGTRCC